MEIESLIDAGTPERNQRIPMRMEYAAIGDLNVVVDTGGGSGRGRMRLECRLRREDRTRTLLDADGLSQCVAREDAGSGAGDDDIGGVADGEGAADPERRFGVGVHQNRSIAAPLEHQFQMRAAAD